MYHIKNDKRSKLSAQLIYEALCTLMASRQLEDIKVTEIAKMADIGRATFYRNFDAPIDVLRYRSDEIFHGLMAHLMSYHSKEHVSRSSEFLVPFLEYFDAHSDFVSLIINAGRTDLLADSMNLQFAELFKAYSSVADAPDETWDYFVAMRSGITVNILTQWVKNGKNIEPKRLGELLGKQLTKSFSVDQFM